MALAPLSVSFQSLVMLPTIKLGPSGAYSWVGGFVYILGPCGKLSSELSCEDRSFSFSFNPLRCSPGWRNLHCCTVVMLYVREGSEREQCGLLYSLPVFGHFPHYPQSNWALLVLTPQVGGCVSILGPCLSNKPSCEAGSFSCCCLNPHRCFQSEALRLYFPKLEPWVVWSVSFPSCSSRFICMQMWEHPVLNQPPCWSASCHLAALPATTLPTLLCQPPPCRESSLPSCTSPPLLPL